MVALNRWDENQWALPVKLKMGNSKESKIIKYKLETSNSDSKSN